MKSFVRQVLGLLFCVWAAVAQAQLTLEPANRVLDLSGTPGESNITRYVDVLEDPSGQWGLNDVLQPGQLKLFQTATAEEMNYGYSKTVYWGRLTLQNPSNQPVSRLLSVAMPISLTVYGLNAHQPEQALKTGTGEVFSSRPYPNRQFIFPIELAPEQVLTLYFRVQSVSTSIKAVVWQKDVFHQQDKADYVFQASYFGLVAGLAVYNLLLFVLLRERVYLYYVGYVLMLSLGLAANNEILHEYVFPNHPELCNGLLDSYFLMAMALALLFARKMLDTRAQLPKLDRTMQATALGLFLLAWMASLNRSMVSEHTPMLVALTIGELLAASACLTYRRQRTGALFLIAFSMPIVGATMMTLYVMGLIPPSYFAINGLQIGAAVEMVLLALALADRFNTIRKEKALMQLKALEAEQEARRLQQASYESQRIAFESQQLLVEQLQHSQKQLGQALTETQKALSAKSEFLALVSHELRTPLAGVLGLLSLSLRETQEKALIDRLERARHNAELLHTIVNDLIDLSQLEAGQLQLNTETYELPALMLSVVQPLREQAERKQLPVVLDMDADVPRWLVGDPVRLRQIVLALVGNAIKFTERGQVCVKVHATTAAEQAQLRIDVQDTGIGMDEAVIKRLFESFEQADRSTTRKFEGLGIGLSVSGQLVRLMGGRIHVESVAGQGSTFSLHLTQPIGQSPQLSSGHEMPKMHILVAEDVPTNQIIIEDLLLELGHSVKLVENGEEAVLAVMRESFDLIIMDMRMPLMDGLQATRHIRSGHYQGQPIADSTIPVVALTANVSAKDRSAFMDAGANDFLGKPINEGALQQALNNMVALAQNRGRVLHGAHSAATPEPSEPDLSSLDALLNLNEVATNTEAINLDKSSSEVQNNTPKSAPEPTRQEALRQKMMAVFKAQTPSKLAEIADWVKNNHWDQVAIAVHGIKGSAAYIWPNSELYHLAAKMENLADQHDATAFAANWARLNELLQSLLDSFH